MTSKRERHLEELIDAVRNRRPNNLFDAMDEITRQRMLASLKREEKKTYYQIAIFGGIIIASLGLVILLWALSSRQEARVYNRLTGAEVTTWDAMWVQLRVTNTPIQESRE